MRAADPVETARLRALYEAKARAELDAAGPAAVRWSGDPLARVVFVKGVPSEADTAAGLAFAGADGDAARKAAAALGIAGGGLLFLCSRPGPNLDASQRAERLGLQIEAADPAIVVAADAEAADDLAVAFGLSGLPAGEPARCLGRTLGALDGLEASLSDEDLKRRVWAQLRALAAQPDRA